MKTLICSFLILIASLARAGVPSDGKISVRQNGNVVVTLIKGDAAKTLYIFLSASTAPDTLYYKCEKLETKTITCVADSTNLSVENSEPVYTCETFVTADGSTLPPSIGGISCPQPGGASVGNH